ALGAVLLMRFAKEAAKYFDSAEIIELHHNRKLDFPSGTALKTAQLMGEARSQFNLNTHDQTANLPDARGAEYQGIRLHSVRIPGLVAHQEVIFGTTAQTLTLRHDTISRESFMPGVILGIRKITTFNTLLYGLEHLL
ncbi:MAG: Dihydrodipicolinate reductase, partial [Candidatus Magnetoglobus multicellularis str. Araruama]